jgi:serine/threonine protein kinase/WD40 repeat protein
VKTVNVIEAVFFAALEKKEARERAAYLDQACNGDPDLRRCVEKLLAAQPKVGEFLQAPAPGLPAAEAKAGTVDHAPDERPGTILGPYKLLHEIGEGGMGTVWMAEQTEPVKRRVALKVIKPGMDSKQVLARFEAERQALALMDHPNIAKVLDAGATDGGRPYFVMELVKGQPITEFCDKNRLTNRERLELFVAVCNAIQHAHQKGVIHRDVKPTNVLVALYDGKPVPKVIDFGVVKAVGDPLTDKTLFTRHGQVVGTFEYMSPEQATLDQLDIDTRSDVYALGVLLYELLTGTTPLDKDELRQGGLAEVLRRIREQEPPKPSTRLTSSPGLLATAAAYRKTDSQKLPRAVRGELDWIVMKALEKDRNRRFETANGLAADVERFLKGEPVLACPPTLAYRFGKWARKHKVAFATASAVAAALLIGIALTGWQAVRATKAEQAAAHDRDVAIAAEKESAGERDKNAAIVEHLHLNEKQRRRTQYGWDMQIMSTAMDSGRIGQMRQILERHAEEQPGFEWYYWNRQIHNEARSLKFDNAGAIQLSPLFARGPAAEQSRFIMNELGTRVACITRDEDGPAQADADTQQKVTPRTCYLDVYDTADAKRIYHHPFSMHTGFPRMVMQFNRDGSRVALAWSQTNGITPEEAKAGTVGRQERLLKVIEVATGNSVYDLNLGDVSAVTGPAFVAVRPHFFPDGKRLALAVAPVRRPGELPPRDEAKAPAAHVHIIDLTTQPAKEVCPPIEAGNDVVFGGGAASLRISPDGTRLAFISAKFVRVPDTDKMRTEQALIVADTTTGKHYSIDVHPDEGPVTSADFSPNGQKLALVQIDRQRPPNENRLGDFVVTVQMLDAQTGKELYKETTKLGLIIGASGPTRTCHFSPDGERLYLSGGPTPIPAQGRVWAFQADSGKPLAGFDSNFSLDKFAFTPDGRAIYSVEGNAVVARNALTGRVVRTFRGHVANIAALGMAADGSSICTLDDYGEFKIWNRAQRPRQFLEGLPVNNGWRTAGAAPRLSPDGQYVVGVPEEQQQPPDAPATPFAIQRDVNSLARWDTSDGHRLPLALPPMPEMPKELATSDLPLSTDNHIEYSADSRFVCLIRVRYFTRRRRDPDPQVEALCEKASFSDLTVWDTATGRQTAHVSVPADWTKGRGIQQISRDGKTAVLMDPGSIIRAVELPSGRVAWTNELEQENNRIATASQQLSLSPDGRLLLHFVRNVYRTRDNGTALSMLCQVIDPASGKELRRFTPPNERSFFGVSWSPDSKRIALTPRNRFGPNLSSTLTHIISVETGKVELSLAAPPGGSVTLHEVAFSPDGRRFAARESDRGALAQTNIKVWDAADGTEMLSLPVDPGLGTFVSPFFNPGLAFSADGHRLIEFVPEGGVGSARREDHRYATVRVIDATPPEPK